MLTIRAGALRPAYRRGAGLVQAACLALIAAGCAAPASDPNSIDSAVGGALAGLPGWLGDADNPPDDADSNNISPTVAGATTDAGDGNSGEPNEPDDPGGSGGPDGNGDGKPPDGGDDADDDVDDVDPPQAGRVSVYFDDHGATGPAIIAEHPDLAAATVAVNWKAVNPAPGVYDWSSVDAAINFYASRGRRVILRTVPYVGKAQDAVNGGHPDWIWDAGVEPISFVDKRGEPFAIPKAWSAPAWLDVYGEWIRAIAARYDGDDRIAAVWIACGHIGHATCQPSRTGSDAVLAAGWTADAWGAYLRSVIDRFTDAFQQTPPIFPSNNFFVRGCSDSCVEPYMVDLSVHAVERGAWLMLSSLDPSGEHHERGPFGEIVEAISQVALPADFTLIGKDDWPLLNGAKERTVEDFEAALDLLLGEHARLGRPNLAIMLLDDELLATHPGAAEFEPAARAVLEAFLEE